jgi:hypothetical protein
MSKSTVVKFYGWYAEAKAERKMSVSRLGRFLQLLIFGISALTLTACGKGQTDPRVRPYYDKFYEEASRRGLTPDEPISVELVDAAQQCDSDNVAGCARSTPLGSKVYIDAKAWEQSSEEQREYVVFHELGHAVMGKHHNETIHEFLAKPLEESCFLSDYVKLPSLMYPTETSLPVTYQKYRTAILDEFFLDKPFPSYQPATPADFHILATTSSLQMNCCKDFPEMGFCADSSRISSN